MSPPERLVSILNALFSRFDAAAVQCGVEKIKTIGDAYMAVAGVPEVAGNHACRMADFAFELREAAQKFSLLNGIELQLRIGMHCGPVVAGVIGTTRLHFDLWGETVKVAAQLESSGVAGEILVSETMRTALSENYVFADLGLGAGKNHGAARRYVLQAPLRHAVAGQSSEEAPSAPPGAEATAPGLPFASREAEPPTQAWALRFSADDESRYRHHRFSGDMKVYRTILLFILAIGTAVTTASLIAKGSEYLGSTPNLSHFGLVVVVGLATLSAFLSKPSIRSLDAQVELGSLALALTCGIIASFVSPANYAGAIAGYFVILSGYFALPMIFAVRLRAMSTFTGAYLFGLWSSPSREAELATIVYFFMVAGTAIYLFVARVSERTQRATYIAVTETARHRARANVLLRSILPPKIADRLQDRVSLREAIVQRYDSATIMFSDLVGFTHLAQTQTPENLVALLNSLFSQIDQSAVHHGVEKIKTIGYTYMAVSGVPDPSTDHVQRMADFALDVRDIVRRFADSNDLDLAAKTGIHCGPLVAGVIGTNRFHYDLWGETVNTASRLESHGVKDAIQVSEAVRSALGSSYDFSDRGLVALKGMQQMQLYLLTRLAKEAGDAA